MKNATTMKKMRQNAGMKVAIQHRYWMVALLVFGLMLNATNNGNAQTYLSESFEGAWSGSPVAPSGWLNVDGSGSTNKTWEKATYSAGTWTPAGSGTKPAGAYDGTSVAHYNDYNATAGQVDKLQTPVVDLSASINPRLTFYYAYPYTSWSGSFKVYGSTNGGSTWTLINTYSYTGSSATWTKVSIPLSSYKVATAKFSFEVTAGFGNADLWLDNVIVDETPSPLHGTYSINNTLPTSNPLLHDGTDNFASFTAAINMLNEVGVSSSVTFNVSAGQVFNETPPVITATGTGSGATPTNSITFRKSGAGTNPKIVPAAGTLTSASSGDFAIGISGGDYFTFDGIDIDASGAGSIAAAMEYGFLLKNASATNGAQYNTIKNCAVTLNKSYAVATSFATACIMVSSNSTYGGAVTATTSSANSCNYNNFYNLTLSNAQNGIVMYGASSSIPLVGNQVGVEGAGCQTARTSISNIGGTVSISSYGIYANGVSDLNVFNCDIGNVKGKDNFASGVYVSMYSSTNQIFNNKINDISTIGTTNTYASIGARFESPYNASAIVRVFNNFIWDIKSSFTGSATSSIYVYGIYDNNSSNAAAGEIDNNNIYLSAGSATYSSACYGASSTTGVHKVRGNIFVNAFPNQTTANHVCWYSPSTNSIGATGSISQYNDLYVTGTNGFVGRGSTTTYAALSNWQGRSDAPDASSVSEDPLFAGTADLHLISGSPNSLYIAGFSPQSWGANDIDCESRTVTTLIGADYTVISACAKPANFAASSVTSTTATLTWSAATPAPSQGYEIYYSTSSTAPTSGTSPTATVGAGVLTYNMTGLSSNTTYYAWVRSHCVGSDFSTWTNSISFTTPCGIAAIPYLQDFESVTVPAIPVCNSIQNTGSANNWATASNPGYGFTTKCLKYSYNGSYSATAWYYTQGVNLTAGTTYRITFNYGNYNTSTTEKLKVWYGTSAVNTAMTNAIVDYPTINQGSIQSSTTDFTPSTSGVYYFGFNCYSNANQYYLYVDNILVDLAPTCIPPSGLASSAVGSTTATLTWSAASPLPSQGYDVYYSTSSTAPTAGTTPTASVAAGVLAYNVTGLSPTTTYYAWVRSHCVGTDFSTWTSSTNFTTTCAEITGLPWTENFDAVTTPALPACWLKEGTGDWMTTYNASNSSDADAHSGTQFLREAYSATNEYVWTPGILLAAGTSYDFSFFWAGDNYSGWTGDVFYNTSQGSTGAVQMGGSFVASGTTTTKNYAEAVRTFVAPTSGVYYFAVRVNATSSPYYLSLDDFSLRVTPTCFTPTALTSSAVAGTTATISWTAASPAPSNGYQYEVRTSGAAGSGSTGLAVNGNTAAGVVTADVAGLAPLTMYYAYVRSYCGGTDYSTWTNASSFTTTATCFTPSSLGSSSITHASATLTWSAPTPAPSSGYDIYYSTSSTAPTSGTTPTATVGAGVLTYNMTGLSENTTYYAWIRSHCIGSDASDWTSSINFTTPLTPRIFVNATSSTAYGEYTTLKNAFDAINAGSHQGVIAITLGETDNAVITETAQAVLNKSGSGSASYSSITISPAHSNITITGNLATSATIQLYMAQNVTFDGRIGGSGSTNDLTIENSSTGASSKGAIDFFGASSNAIKYCNIKSSTNNTGNGCGTISMNYTTNSGPSNNLIEYCNITKSGANKPLNAIASSNISITYNSQNNTVRYCTISDFQRAGIWLGNTSGTDYNNMWTIDHNTFYQSSTISMNSTNFYNYAIQVGYHDAGGSTFRQSGIHTVTNNTIGGNGSGGKWTVTCTSDNSDAVVGGIFFAGSTTAYSEISGNEIKDYDVVTYVNGADNISGFNGIYCYHTKAKIGSSAGNSVHDITLSHPSTWGGLISGVILKNNTNYDCEISNNQVYDIIAVSKGAGASDMFQNFYGIYDWAESSLFNDVVNKNSVYNIDVMLNSHGYGIHASGAITQNHVSKIKVGGTANSDLTGIFFYGVSTVNRPNLRVENNEVILGLDKDDLSTAVNKNIYGITIGGIGYAYYNSILIQGTHATNNTCCLKMNTSSGTGFCSKNNLLYNERTGGTGKHYCIMTNGVNPITSSNNSYIINSGAKANYYVGNWNGTDKSTLGDWQTAATETASITETPSNKPVATLFPNLTSGVNPLLPMEDAWLKAGISVATMGDKKDDSRPTAPTTVGAYEIETVTLPVELLEIKAYKLGVNNVVEWKTASETNNDYFEVQKSTDATDWKKIGKVKGAGNSNSVISYSFNDVPTNDATTEYYRIKQVDYDGKCSYSPIASVNHSVDNIQTHLYPVPANDFVYITYHSTNNNHFPIFFKLYNCFGTVVKQDLLADRVDGEIIKINLDDVAPGHYYLALDFGSEVKIMKLIIVR